MTRNELYEHFGPKLVEAIVLVVKDEINLLRLQLGLSERTNEQIRNVVSSKLESLSDYGWMEETEN